MADSQITQTAASFDLSTIATHLVILAGFIAATIGGVWTGLKRVRESLNQKEPAPGQQVLAATILENRTLHEWTASNRDVVKALHEVRDAMYATRDTNHDLRHAIAELRHHIELSDAKRG